jgi:hyperosmotically inducible periplasmic protein
MLKRLAIVASTTGIVLTLACAHSDPGISTAVKTRLAADETVKAYQIDVDTDNGIVTLSGAVETTAARDQAVIVARQTDGVRDVVDLLTVDPIAAATTGDLTEDAREGAREVGSEVAQAGDRTAVAVTDAAVTTAVKTRFLADTAVSGLKIDVDTRDGVVTLNGMVPTRSEADQAVSVARNTKGVKSVVDNLRLGR